MDELRFFALLRVDIKRGAPTTARALAAIAALSLFFVVRGDTAGDSLGIALAATSVMYVMTVPLMTFKDKMDGTLEFLTTLPVSGSVVASSRLAAAGLATLPGAGQIAVAFGLFAAPILGVEAVGPSILYIGALAWIAIAMGSFLAVALIIRFDVTNLLSAPFFLMFAAIFGGDWVVSKLFDDPLASFQAFVAMPWAPHIVAGLLAISLLSLVGLSFVLAKQGIERYRPTPDAIGW